MNEKQNGNTGVLKSLPKGAAQHDTAGPYSPVLIVNPGKLVVLSGQAAIDKEGNIVGDTIEEQTRFMMENCQSQLSSADCTFDDVFKVTLYLRDIGQWSTVNQIYETYFSTPRPVRTAVQTGLIGELLVEIEMWAVQS
ncbi:RidA family protein [Membranihabitans maritimus]|uniref:RidA family protein n=1 Tax=Membranihabitans maritimus TaxID=2904244 RepID=UPI001F277851|nr:RidA family protein [Membranihabitans maritimus]